MKDYNYSTVLTNYLFRNEQTPETIKSLGLETIPFSVIHRELLNEDEIYSRDYVVEHEARYGQPPTLETMKLYNGGEFEHLISTRMVGEHEIPSKGHKENYKYLIECFDNFARTRKIQSINSMYGDSDDGMTSDEYLDMINSIPRITTTEVYEVFQSYEDELKEVDKISDGVYLGFNPTLDREIGMLTKGKLCLITGRTGTNKTYMSQIAAIRASVLQGKKVLFCSYEMTKEQVAQRFKSILGRFNSKLYTVPTERNKEILRANLQVVSEYLRPMYSHVNISIAHNATVTDVSVLLKDEIEETGIPYDLIIFDGAYLIPLEGKTGWEKTLANLDLIKDIKLGDASGSNGVQYSIILTAQLGKGKNGETLDDIADTVRLSQDPNMVISIFDEGHNIRTAKVLKNRDGEVPRGKFFYAIDYNTSTLLKPTDSFEGVGDFGASEGDGDWEASFNLIDKRNLVDLIENADAEVIATSMLQPDLKENIYEEVQEFDFIYPFDSEEYYSKFSKEDKERWTIFCRQTPNMLLANSYAMTFIDKYGVANEGN